MFLMPENKWARLLAYVTGLVNQKFLLQNVLCLPQIPSAAGGGRPVPTANQNVRAVLRPGAIDGHEKSTLRFGEQGASRLVGPRESAHLLLDRNCGEDCYVQAARRS
jgi:hypothetical protein